MQSITIFPVGGISAMFEPFMYDDPLKSGARGAGLGVKNAAKINLSIYESDKPTFKNIINGVEVPSGIGLIVTQEFFKQLGIDNHYKIVIEQEIYIPIGSGFGSSAASAVAIIYGLSKLLNKNLSLLQIARIAHIAEVKAKTGLGTVAGLVCPGDIIIVKTPGPPGACKVDKIILDDDYLIVAASKGKIETAEALKDPSLVEKAKKFGKKAVDELIEKPSVEDFFRIANRFARETGLSNKLVEEGIRVCVEKGAIGAAQSMIGDAVFALVKREKLESVKRALSKIFGVRARVFEIAESPIKMKKK